ncbi:MAG TPA: ABC transporter permease [Planctomycetota bacterium]|nr:ABC transporter permease [Planctomycetota bacterium]HUV38862.1 ABC transporter permease [Planctomycetota bacterium]
MTVTRFQHRRDLVAVLLAKEFKVRYKNTLLGYAWSLVHPLLFAGVFVLVFSKLIRPVPTVRVPYVLLVITALFPWQWFLNSVTSSNYFFLGNASLIKKVNFPRVLLVFSAVLSDLVHFVISVPVIALFILAYHFRSAPGAVSLPSVHWLWQVPLLVVVQFAAVYGLSLIVATVNLFFRDLERLTSILMQLWFFLTPVIYPPELLMNCGLGWILDVNPLAWLVGCWRDVFLEGTMPWGSLGATAVFATVLCVAGQLLYRKLEWRFAEIV